MTLFDRSLQRNSGNYQVTGIITFSITELTLALIIIIIIIIIIISTRLSYTNKILRNEDIKHRDR
jgi:hypothetical protein